MDVDIYTSRVQRRGGICVAGVLARTRQLRVAMSYPKTVLERPVSFTWFVEATYVDVDIHTCPAVASAVAGEIFLHEAAISGPMSYPKTVLGP